MMNSCTRISLPPSGLPAARCGGLRLSPGLSSPVARRFYSGVEKRLSRQSHKLEKAGSTPAAANNLVIFMAYKNSIEQKICAKKSYEMDKAAYKHRAMIHKKRAIQRNRIYILDYLKHHHCAVCGESDPLVLQFDHIENYKKTMDISNAIQNAWGLAKLRNEIDKCQVLCANCHARKSAMQLGWYKAIELGKSNATDLFGGASHDKRDAA